MHIIPVGNKCRIICLLVITSLLLAGCFGGISDWTYELPNNYAIVRVNSQTVVFGKNADTFEQILSRYIIAYSFNDTYIGLKRIPMDNVPQDSLFDVNEIDMSHSEYYLIDTTKEQIFGPYTYDEYIELSMQLDIGTMSDWIDTRGQVAQ